MLCEEEEESEQPEELGHGKHGHALVREVRAGRTEHGSIKTLKNMRKTTEITSQKRPRGELQ